LLRGQRTDALRQFLVFTHRLVFGGQCGFGQPDVAAEH
jgi:hypothetical protein